MPEVAERRHIEYGDPIPVGDNSPFVDGLTETMLDQRMTKSYTTGRSVAVADFAKGLENKIRERLAAAIKPGAGHIRIEANFEAILSEVMKALDEAQPNRR